MTSGSEVSRESPPFIFKKRYGRDLEDEESETPPKRVKLRDLESVFLSEGMGSHYPGSSKNKSNGHIEKSSILEADRSILGSIDLNRAVHIVENPVCIETMAKSKVQRSLYRNEDTSSTVNLVQFYPITKTCSDNTKPKGSRDCGTSTGPVMNTSLKKWAEMKQNGFISPNYGNIPAPPKQRGRKSKAEVLRRKMEQAQKEQADKFAKIAAPSGLLKGLNPGIINHVRNSKQVHSIIKALVSERGENNDQENVDPRIHQSNLPYGKYAPHNRQTSKDAHALPYEEYDDPLALKLSSSAVMVSANASSLSLEKTVKAETVDSLSAKAANVASQWLHLLYQDIEGRILALQCSKQRVQHVLTTELPSILSKELSSKQENTFLDKKPNLESHHARWITMFCRMEQELNKEEKELETQLNQVNNMMTQCEKGLEFLNKIDLPLMVATGKGCRSGNEKAEEGELAMKAAAASIYSTCSFALSMA